MNDVQSINEIVEDVLRDLVDSASEFVPKLVSAAVILLIGWAISKVISRVVSRALSAGKPGELLDKGYLAARVQNVGVESKPSGLIGKAFYWIVYLGFITSAADIVGLEIVGESTRAFFDFLPSVFAALIVLAATMFFARIVNKVTAATLSQMGVNFASVIASVGSSLIIVFGATIALAQVGIETDIVTNNLTVVIAGFVAMFVIAVGLGSRGTVENIVAGYHGQNHFKVGDTIHYGSIKGKITAVSNVAVTVHHNGADEVIPFSALMNN